MSELGEGDSGQGKGSFRDRLHEIKSDVAGGISYIADFIRGEILPPPRHIYQEAPNATIDDWKPLRFDDMPDLWREHIAREAVRVPEYEFAGEEIQIHGEPLELSVQRVNMLRRITEEATWNAAFPPESGQAPLGAIGAILRVPALSRFDGSAGVRGFDTDGIIREDDRDTRFVPVVHFALFTNVGGDGVRRTSILPFRRKGQYIDYRDSVTSVRDIDDGLYLAGVDAVVTKTNEHFAITGRGKIRPIPQHKPLAPAKG